MPTPLPWRLKRYDTGSASFVNAELRKWNGTSWVTADMYFYDGVSWVLCTDRTPPTSTYNEQYNNVGGASYQNDNSPSGLTNRYQGYYDGVYGIHKSMMWFDYATISAALLPRVTTYSCQIYLSNLHFYYTSGGYAVIGTSDYGWDPGSFQYNRYNDPGSFAWGKTEAKWVTVTNNLAVYFADQTARSLTLYANSFDPTYYGYFSPSCSLYFSYEK